MTKNVNSGCHQGEIDFTFPASEIGISGGNSRLVRHFKILAYVSWYGMISKKDFFFAEDVYQSSFNFAHIDCDNVDCDGVVNCPTQPTCIAHFDLCIC